MRLLLLFLIVFLAACTSEPSSKQAPILSINQKLDNLIQRYESLDRFKGEVLVAYEDSIFYAYQSKGIEAAEFPLGELSEGVLGALLLKLQSTGELNLHTRLNKELPDFSYGAKIDYWDLLMHQAGLETIDSIQDRFPEEQYGPIRFANLSKRLNKRQEYKSELNYDLMTKALERKFQFEIADIFKNTFGSTGIYFKKEHENKQFALFSQKYDEKRKALSLVQSQENLTTTAAYSLYSTSEKLLEFYQRCFIQGELDSAALSIFNVKSKGVYKAGFFVDSDSTGFVLQNNSSKKRGHNTQVLINKAKRVIVLVNNRVDKNVSAEMLSSSWQLLQNKKVILPLPRDRFLRLKDSLGRFVGDYEQAGFELKINEQDSQLVASWKGGKSVLIPQSETRFFFNKKDASIDFLMEEEQVVFYPGLIRGDTLVKARD